MPGWCPANAWPKSCVFAAGAWTSKCLTVSHSLEDLGSKQVSIVHVRRPEAAVKGVPAVLLLPKHRQVGNCAFVAPGDASLTVRCVHTLLVLSGRKLPVHMQRL